MSVKIRLRRTGKRNAACHRIVVADSRCPRDGRFIENIGFYDPRHKNEKIDLQRVDYWLPRGAQPSETVSAIINRARAGKPMASEQEAVTQTVEVTADAVSAEKEAATEPASAENEAATEPASAESNNESTQ